MRLAPRLKLQCWQPSILPAQVAHAISSGFNPQVYASEALGLVLAFTNENGSSAIR